MTLRFSHLVNLRIAAVAIAGLLALFGVSHWFVAVFVPARYEVVYHHDVRVNFCHQGNCAYSAVLEVANTGREVQARVDFVISGLLSDVGASPRILNLDASYPRTADPVIEQTREADVLTISLRDFTPGTLVEFTFRGFFPEGDLARALEAEISVSGRGRMVRGDPRGVAFGRFFSRAAPASGNAGARAALMTP